MRWRTAGMPAPGSPACTVIRTASGGAREAGPEPDEETERERNEDAIAGPHAGAGEHEAPAARPPVPRRLRVQPPERRAAGAGGLVQAHVALRRIGEVGTERGARLVLDEFGLARQRQPLEVVPAAQI